MSFSQEIKIHQRQRRQWLDQFPSYYFVGSSKSPTQRATCQGTLSGDYFFLSRNRLSTRHRASNTRIVLSSITENSLPTSQMDPRYRKRPNTNPICLRVIVWSQSYHFQTLRPSISPFPSSILHVLLLRFRSSWTRRALPPALRRSLWWMLL